MQISYGVELIKYLPVKMVIWFKMYTVFRANNKILKIKTFKLRILSSSNPYPIEKNRKQTFYYHLLFLIFEVHNPIKK